MVFQDCLRMAAGLGMLLLTGQHCEGQKWTSIGPSPIIGGSGPTGRITAVAVDPSNHRHWLLGSAGGGVWESPDSGSSWTPLTAAHSASSISSIAFAPSNPRIIYAGTGEATYLTLAQAGQGILKSVDGGASWTPVGRSAFARAAVSVIRVDPANPNILTASMTRATSGRNGELFTGSWSPPPFGVQRSTDGGLTWTLTLQGESTALEVDALDFMNQYAAISLPTGYGPYNRLAETGIYRSTDGGQTWKVVAGPWGNAGLGRIQLALAPSDRNVLYASIQGPDGKLLGLFRTTNAWDPAPVWSQVNTGTSWSTPGCNVCADYCGPNCTLAHIIAVDPADPNTLYAGGASLWRCDSCGNEAKWTEIGAAPQRGWTLPANKRTIAWAGDRLIAGTDGGVFSTATRSEPWRDDSGGLPVARLVSGALHPTDPDIALAGMAEGGPVAWAAAPAWRGLGFGVGEVALSETNPAQDMMAVSGARILRSKDGGLGFFAADQGFDATGTAGALLPVRKCPANDDIFVAGATRLYRTNEFFSGSSPAWSANGPAGSPVRSIAFAESDAACGTYAYGTAAGEVFLTLDGGTTWKNLDAGGTLPRRAVLSLAFDSSNANALYAAFAGFDEGDRERPGHLFKTANAQASSPRWINIGPPANLPHNVVAVDPADPNSIFVGTDSAIWHTTNGGADWQFHGPSTGLPNVPVFDLKINAVTGRIAAFTFGRGAFTLEREAPPPGGTPLAIATSPAIQANMGSAFSLQLEAGGTPPYSWSLASGSLPPGLVLSATGELKGTPLSPGVFAFVVMIKDGASSVASRTFTLTVGTQGTSPVWSSLGPAPFTYYHNPADPAMFNAGRVAAIAVDPANADRWLAGFGNGGIWESRDAGVSWVPLFNAAPTLATGAIAFAPSKPEVLYAATGEGAGQGFTRSGLGLLKSTDGGKTWNMLAASTFARGSVRRIRVHPSNPDILLAAVVRGGYGRDSREGTPSSPPPGVLKSTDGGSTWTRTLAGQATALEIHPANFNNQYAAIGDFRNLTIVEKDSPGSALNGVYRSTDGGQTWAPVAGPWGASSPSRAAAGRIELAISPSNPNVLYASMAAPPNGGSSSQPLLGLYRTENAWAATPAWVQVPIRGLREPDYCGPTKCNYSHVISVDPANPSTLYAGGSEGGLFRCDNCGLSPEWTIVVSPPTVHSDCHAMAWSGSRLIVGNDGGVWSSDDRGANWTNHNATFSTGQFYTGALHPTNPDFMLGGVRDQMLVARTASNRWLIFANPGTTAWGEAEVAFSRQRPDTDWMGAWIWGIIHRTTDGGRTRTPADKGIDKTGSAFVAPVRQCPHNESVFVTGTTRAWRTDNFFSSAEPVWAANGPAHPAPFPFALDYPGTILTIDFAPSDRTCNTYAFGNRGGEVQITRDGGKTWTDLDPRKTLPPRPVNSLAIDPGNPEVIYAALSSFDDATPGKPGHVFKTTNALSSAPSWTNISPPVNQPFNAVAIEPQNPRIVYAGSDTGLWRSMDGGATWARLGPEVGVPNAPVHDIKMNPATGRTVVFTYGRGAFALGPELVSASAPVSAGGEVVLTGTHLAGVTGDWQESDLEGSPGTLPFKVSGVEVKFNGAPASVRSISPGRVSVQAPADLSGTVSIQVIRDGVPSNILTVNVGPMASTPSRKLVARKAKHK